MTADDDRKRRLEKTVTDLQGLFGLRAIGRSADAPAPAVIATGFPALDAALGIGGLPRGRVSEIAGTPTAGAATLALKSVAQAGQGAAHNATRGAAVYIDMSRTFDPDHARRCGVDLHWLMIIHPYTPRQAIVLLPDLVAGNGLDLIVFDMPLHPPLEPERRQQLSSTLGRLLAPLNRSNAVLLFVTSLPPESDPVAGCPRALALPHYASLRLLVRRARWLHRRQDVRGYEADVVILKHKLGKAGGETHIAVTFDGTVQGDAV